MKTENNGRVLSSSVRTDTPDLELSRQQCVTAGKLDPCTILIVGASGDLTERKLMPALFNLFVNGGLPSPFLIVGCGRTELSDEEFRSKMYQSIAAKEKGLQAGWQSFAQSLHFRSVSDYGDLASFKALHEQVDKLGETAGTRGNLLVYLAIPPSLYKVVTRMVGQAFPVADERGWIRIVVEKPFGRDLATAMDLDRTLHQYFQENRIFRIDHYLAKETVQNVLMLRFANSIFEPVWNRVYISHVHILAAEDLGLERRSGYYEKSGVLRDMFQNHMMQLLALTAMEPPSLFEAEQVRDEKAKVFRALRPFPVENLRDYIVLGQYRSGVVNGASVKGYREEPGVAADSLTPTFASMRVYLDNWRWQGVPFYLTSGKRLAEKRTEITIHFREIPHSMFRTVFKEPIAPNGLTLGIYPEEKVTLTFQAKNPGALLRFRPVTMDFFYTQNYSGPVLEAYEKVLIDCIRGDQMLFWRQDGVELCWSFLTPILSECETCGYRAEMLQFYEAGSWGPKSFLEIG